MSDLIKMALHPIIREINRRFKVWCRRIRREYRVCLTGPASGVRNAVPYLSESLQVEVSLMTGTEALFERLSGIGNPMDAKTQAWRAATRFTRVGAQWSRGRPKPSNTDFRVGEFAEGRARFCKGAYRGFCSGSLSFVFLWPEQYDKKLFAGTTF